MTLIPHLEAIKIDVSSDLVILAYYSTVLYCNLLNFLFITIFNCKYTSKFSTNRVVSPDSYSTDPDQLYTVQYSTDPDQLYTVQYRSGSIVHCTVEIRINCTLYSTDPDRSLDTDPDLKKLVQKVE